MEKLLMCRICLVENVRMFVVADKNLQEMYEKLTDVPFVTEDNRPMLACVFCYEKLKQSYQLQRNCLEAEEMFAQMLNNCELKALTNQGHSESVGGFVKTAIENMSLVEDVQPDSGTIEIELPAFSEKQCDIVQIKVERERYELEHLDNSYPDVADIPPDYSESDSQDVPLIACKIEVVEVKEEAEEQEVSKTNQRANNTKRAPVVKNSKLIGGTSIAKQKKTGPSDSKSTWPTQTRMCKSVTRLEPFTITNPTVNNSDVYRSNEHIKGVETNLIDYIHSAIDTSCISEKDEKVNLRNHILEHGDKPFKCHFCQRGFDTKCHLDKHVLIHTGEKPYKCGDCQLCFSEKSKLLKHICQQGLNLLYNFKQHYSTNAGEKPQNSIICPRSFTNKTSLTNHHHRDTAEKPYKCFACQRSFTHKRSWDMHLRKHTGEKLFKCEQCQRGFTQSSHLKQHIRTHTGENPYKCEQCQRGFTQSSHLKQHLRTHTGEKPFKCEHCQKCFTQSSHLRQHLRIHTGEKSWALKAQLDAGLNSMVGVAKKHAISPGVVASTEIASVMGMSDAS